LESFRFFFLWKKSTTVAEWGRWLADRIHIKMRDLQHSGGQVLPCWQSTDWGLWMTCRNCHELNGLKLNNYGTGDHTLLLDY
jgi:hypothetical protein